MDATDRKIAVMALVLMRQGTQLLQDIRELLRVIEKHEEEKRLPFFGSGGYSVN